MKILINLPILHSKTLNSGKNSESLKKVIRVVCPECMSAEIITISKDLQKVKCHACGHEYKVKNEVR